MMVKLLSDCKRGTEPQGIAADYCYLLRRQCLSIKYIAIKKVYLSPIVITRQNPPLQ